MSGSRLPNADLELYAAERRAQAAAAKARRVEREKNLAIEAARWLGDDLVDGPLEFRQQYEIVVRTPKVHGCLEYLRDQLGFAMFIDCTAIDYLKYEHGEHPERFAVMWTVANLDQEAYLRVKAYVDEDDPVLQTASDIWPGSNWAEREVYDMYGIEFRGHPNLIRLLCPEEFSGHPLRKDYPLRGRGERDNFPVIRRGAEEGY